MNIFDAKRISNSFQEAITKEFNLDCWQLGYPEHAARSKSQDLQSTFMLNKDTAVLNLYYENLKSLERYISKKLSSS
jgi:hypothetical protein